MPKKKGRQPLTLIVVPYAERPPISFSVPTWLLPLAGTVVCVFGLVLFVGVGALLFHSYSLTQEIRELRQDRQLHLVRESEMRTTILVQQQEVRSLAKLVGDVQAELANVAALSGEIRELIRLPAPTRTPVPAQAAYAVAAYKGMTTEEALAFAESDARGGRVTSQAGQRGMTLAVEKSQEVIAMQETLPATLRELVYLRDQVLTRVEKIEPEKRTDRAELEKQLRLLAAAPHMWPTEVRRISSKFGYRALLGSVEFHNGIDLLVWYGSKVLATKDGVVVKAGWQTGYGWVVEIEHEMGFHTIYGHNSKLLVRKGDEVKAGDLIALSGNSGRSTGPHLHYEIRLNGVAVDPLKYLDTDVPYVIDK